MKLFHPPLRLSIFYVSRDQPRPGSFLKKREEPGNEVVRYVEKTSAECNEDSYLAILHLSRVELHCKLHEKLHCVTWP